MQKRAQQSVHWTLGILRNFGVVQIIRAVVEYPPFVSTNSTNLVLGKEVM
jgi:hypothetical protein